MAGRRSKGRPIGEVIEDFRAEGLIITLDDVQRLRAARIVAFKDRLATADVERLRLIVDARDALGPKWSMPQLAFVLEYIGAGEVPAELVAEYIEDQIESWLRHQKRLLSRQGRGAAFKGKPPHERLALVAVRKHARDVHLRRGDPRVERSVEAMVQWWSVLYGAAEYGLDLHELDAYVRRGVELTVERKEDEPALYRAVRETLGDGLPWLRLNARSNALLKAVREAGYGSSPAIGGAVRDARRVIEYVNFTLAGVPEPTLGPMSKAAAYGFGRMLAPMPAIFAAICLAVRKRRKGRIVLDRLRRGELPDWQQAVADWYSRSAVAVAEVTDVT